MLQRLLGIRRVLALVIGVPCLLLTVAAMGFQAMFGDGKLVFVAPADTALDVVIDGTPHQVAPGTHTSVKVTQGAHALKLSTETDTSSRTVDVKNGFTELLVPSHPKQCFAVFDVSKSHFTYGSKQADQFPKVVQRVMADDVFDLPGSTWFSEEELPHEIDEGHSCNLLLEVDCDLLKRPDSDLFEALFE